jgi:hypothetical protein
MAALAAAWDRLVPHDFNNISQEKIITINVPLFKKLRDIIFFAGGVLLFVPL